MKNKIFFTEKDGNYILPISRNGFTTNDKNSEFTDGILMSWTYPFDVLMTDDMIRSLGDFNDPNLLVLKKFDKGILNIEGQVYDAKLKFISSQNKTLKCQLEYGYESLSVFDKKLSELEMELISPTNIYNYIDSIIDKKYPETKVCFPAIYTDKFKDVDRGAGFTFQDVYNELGSNGLIKKNEITNEGFYNRNIVKPLVYLMHILKHGFLSEGFEIAGDILDNEFLMNAAVDHDSEFFTKFSQQKENVSVSVSNNYYYSTQPTFTDFSVTRTVKAKGLYYLSLVTNKDIINIVSIGATWTENGNAQSVVLNYAGNHGPDYLIELSQLLPVFLNETDVNITISGNVYDVPNISGTTPGDLSQKDIQGYLNPATNINGTKEYYEIHKSINFNEIVPDITFRDLVGIIKRWQNYKLIPKDGKMYFLDVEKDLSEIVNISESDVTDFEISTNERLSFILSHGSPDEYNYADYEYDRTGIINSSLNLENEQAEKIVFNGYPLPIENKGYGMTAAEKSDIGSALVLVRYEGLQNSKNLTIDLQDLKIPSVYQQKYKKWIRNRIEARKMKWSVYTSDPKTGNITSERKIGAYKNKHKIIGITKKFVGDNAYYLEFDTENRP